MTIQDKTIIPDTVAQFKLTSIEELEDFAEILPRNIHWQNTLRIVSDSADNSVTCLFSDQVHATEFQACKAKQVAYRMATSQCVAK